MSLPPINSMSSAARTPDAAVMLHNILSFINFDLSFASGATTRSIVEDVVSDDMALIGMLIGVLVCLIWGFLMLIDVALKMRRERAVILKETLVEKKARWVKMDVEIEASARLSSPALAKRQASTENGNLWCLAEHRVVARGFLDLIRVAHVKHEALSGVTCLEQGQDEEPEGDIFMRSYYLSNT
ncbi:hypothetical protein EV368DRAFT_68047 [Lentinula lateritia]|nr:hypothetical protein EV368DRAFT_68047 [Lentinula lateritia]